MLCEVHWPYLVILNRVFFMYRYVGPDIKVSAVVSYRT